MEKYLSNTLLNRPHRRGNGLIHDRIDKAENRPISALFHNVHPLDIAIVARQYDPHGLGWTHQKPERRAVEHNEKRERGETRDPPPDDSVHLVFAS
jgi:hypothetical protein